MIYCRDKKNLGHCMYSIFTIERNVIFHIFVYSSSLLKMPFLNQGVKRIRISPLSTAFEHLRRFRDTNPWPPRPHAARAFPPLFPKFSLTCHVLCRRHVLCNTCWEFLPVIAKGRHHNYYPRDYTASEKVQTGWGVQTDKQHPSAAVIHDQTGGPAITPQNPHRLLRKMCCIHRLHTPMLLRYIYRLQ